MLRTQAALGLRPLTAPVIVFLPLGVIIGPHGLNWLSDGALAHLDVVITIGLAIGTGRHLTRRLLAASSVEAALTILIVGGATYTLLHAWQIPSPAPYVLTALTLGICASASAAPWVSESDQGPGRIAAHVADLDDVLPIVLGGAALALIGAGETTAWNAVVLSIGLGLAIAVSGWILFERSEGAERDVFVLGTLALLGGAAAYLETSPLLAGLAAGWLWVRTPGGTDAVVTAHLRKVQHPLVVLILIIGGASIQPTLAGIWLFAPYVVFRTAGKLIGGWVASRLSPHLTPSDLGAYLIPPGVIGIAFALNILQVAPDPARPIVFAVATGAVVSEFIALLVTRGQPDPTPV
jgi:hypothetical protein